MKNLKTYLKNKYLMITLAIGVAGIYAGLGAGSSSYKIKGWNVVYEGVSTCFSRVGQTFTAKALGDMASGYLQNSFLSSTEECFGEVIGLVEDGEVALAGASLNTLNEISRMIYEFHRVVPLTSDIGALSERYGNIETSINQVHSTISKLIRDSSTGVESSKSLLSFYAVAILIFGTIGLIVARKRTKQNERIESLAKFELTQSNKAHDRVGELINMALDNNDMLYCAELMTAYQNEQTLADKAFVSNKVYVEDSPGQVVETLQRSSFSLDKGVAIILDRFSKDLQKNGIILQVGVTEDDNVDIVKGSEESLIQLFYILTKKAQSALLTEANLRKISFDSTLMGGLHKLKIKVSSLFLNESVMRRPLNVLAERKEVDADLQIIHELSKEVGVEVGFSKYRDEEMGVVGTQIEFFFKASTFDKTKRKTKSIVKGTKKELLEQFSNQI